MSQRCLPHRSLARLGVLGVLCGSFWGLGAGVGATVSADAANGRAYELVSPADKGGLPVYVTSGQGIGVTRASVDGNAAVFSSWGIFARAGGGLPTSYRSVRTDSGWRTEGLTPSPVTPDPNAILDSYRSVWDVTSQDLTVGAIRTRDFFDSSDVNDRSDVYVGRTAAVELASRGNGRERTGAAGARLQMMSRDGTHVLFSAQDHLVPEDSGRVGGEDLYDRVGGRTFLVNQADGGGLISRCGSQLAPATWRNAVSPDGGKVVFQVPFAGGVGDPDCARPTEVYMRVGNARTIHVSASQRDPLNPDPNGVASKGYEGASSDGNIIYFSSSELLTDDATSSGCLYRYTVSTGRLECALRLLGVNISKISGDGSRIYFTSVFNLLPDAVFGARNFYVSDRGTIRFIGSDSTGGGLERLITGDEQFRPAVVTPDGGHIVFAVTTRLTSFDNAGYREVYVYDVAGGRTTCLSCDPAGQRPSGSRVTGDATLSSIIQYDLDTPSYSEEQAPTISADGETVVFESSDQLVPGDTNATKDVYEYRDGRLSLVTSGRSSRDSYLIGMGGDGRDVFFATSQSLVPSDVDGGNVDIYDARIGGGFPDTSVPPPSPCLGDACQGPIANTPGTDLLGTETFDGIGQTDDPEPPAAPKKSIVLTRVGTKAQSQFAATGRLALSVRTTGGGTVRVTLTARVRGKNRAVGSAHKVVRATGRTTSKLVVSMNGAGRQALRRTRNLKVRVSVTLSGVRTARSTTIKLTR